MKKFAYAFYLLLLLTSCNDDKGIVKVPAHLSLSKTKKLQIIITGPAPLHLGEVCFYQNDTVVKRLIAYGASNVGDTILVDWKLKTGAKYDLIGLPTLGSVDLYTFEKTPFKVDLKGDSLITKFSLDTVHKKTTY